LSEPELATKFLSDLLDVSHEEIEELLQLVASSNCRKYGEPAYNTFWVPKTSGGKRWIMDPVDPLKNLQRWIGEKFLDLFPPSRFAYGWIRNRSPLTEAKVHLRGKPEFGLSWDVQSCFPSTQFDTVARVFENLLLDYLQIDLGNILEMAKILAALSTIRYGDNKNPVLPMGAPTSTRIVNSLLRRFDGEFFQIISASTGGFNFTYTRYGDDLTVTSPTPLDHRKLTAEVSELLAQYCYVLNPNKARRMQAGGSWPPLEVSGLIFDVTHD